MPSGLGKKIRVAVHAETHLHEKALAAGADLIITQKNLDEVIKS